MFGSILRAMPLGTAVLAAAACFAASPAPSVFPGAVGYGIDTPAGRGGAVLRVTTLDAAGPGSLAAALATPGPRTVVFEVGGIVDLRGKSLVVREPFLTLAGQTAPPVGITLVNGGLRIATHDVLIQHLKVRPGVADRPKRSGWSPDGISTENATGKPGCHHVIIDHCSLTWAIDENLSASGQRHEGRTGTASRITFSNCIIAEGLNNASHEKGPHSKGTLIHDHARDIAIIGNLYASNVERNPMLKPDSGAVVANNLIYNPEKRAIHTSWPPLEYTDFPDTLHPCVLVAVGNLFWHGPDTRADAPMIQFQSGQGKLYARDNEVRTLAGSPGVVLAGTPAVLQDVPFWPAGFEPLPASQVAASVLARAGAWPAARDAVDARIVAGVRQRTGRILDSEREAGGQPPIAPVRHVLHLPATPAADDDGDGYTDLEAWLHAQAALAEGRHAR